MKEIEILEVGLKNRIKVNSIQKLDFKIKKLSK